MRLTLAAIALSTLLGITLAAQNNSAAQAARQWRQQHERAIVDEFIELLKIPNVTEDHDNIRRNADAIVRLLQAHGVASRLVTAAGADPIAFGEIPTPGATRTVVFYAHYDGSRLDPKEWSTPPFTPTLRNRMTEDGGQVIALPPAGTAFDPESRLYARSTSDDKAPIIAMMSALDAMRASNVPLKSNVKFVFEGEEERGSPDLERMLAANKTMFAGDVWLMCDGPVHQTRRPLVYFGARDVLTFDLTVFGPKSELHSGHYGNWAPNPALLLSRLLASMKDAHGRVLVDGFYDGIVPLSDTEKRAIAEAPDIDRDLMREFWLAGTEGAPAKLTELVTLPSLNIRGLSSAHVGELEANVIPASAAAAIDIRLVAGMNPSRTLDRVIEFIRKQGYFVVDTPPGPEIRQSHPSVAFIERKHVGLGTVRTPMDLPISQQVIRTVDSVRGPAVKLPTMGGSLPLAEIVQPLGTRTIVIPIANHDNHQHSANENIRLQNLWDGIELMAALMAIGSS
jgi:acetylornithine deacetylase/succinyl-diaminopimelate desuccinylase-like protein